jgi:hypothetical protein
MSGAGKAVSVRPNIGALLTGNGGALSTVNENTALAGLMLIKEVLDKKMVATITRADHFSAHMQHDSMPFLGERREIRAGFLDRAKPLHSGYLREFPVAMVVDERLSRIISPPPSAHLTEDEATAMLAFLFGATGKRFNGEILIKLMSCASVFSDRSIALGSALSLWEPVPRHPVILALAIESLKAEQIYEPQEPELRAALTKLYERFSWRAWWVEQWISLFERADEIVFTFDRPAWDAAYAELDSRAPQAMLAQLKNIDEDGCDEDDLPFVPPTPRWQALQKLYQNKRAAEENKPALAAACAQPSPKRTKKLKLKGGE